MNLWLAFAGVAAALVPKPKEVKADVEVTRLKAELAETKRQLWAMQVAFSDRMNRVYDEAIRNCAPSRASALAQWQDAYIERHLRRIDERLRSGDD